jgi:hypothetical protein
VKIKNTSFIKPPISPGKAKISALEKRKKSKNSSSFHGYHTKSKSEMNFRKEDLNKSKQNANIETQIISHPDKTEKFK